MASVRPPGYVYRSRPVASLRSRCRNRPDVPWVWLFWSEGHAASDPPRVALPQRWNIGVALAAAMEHRCRSRPAAEAGPRALWCWGDFCYLSGGATRATPQVTQEKPHPCGNHVVWCASLWQRRRWARAATTPPQSTRSREPSCSQRSRGARTHTSGTRRCRSGLGRWPADGSPRCPRR